jgi:hypothetical protein
MPVEILREINSLAFPLLPLPPIPYNFDLFTRWNVNLKFCPSDGTFSNTELPSVNARENYTLISIVMYTHVVSHIGMCRLWQMVRKFSVITRLLTMMKRSASRDMRSVKGLRAVNRNS